MSSEVSFHHGGKPCLEVSQETSLNSHWPKLGAMAPLSLQGRLGKGVSSFRSGRGLPLKRKWGVMAVEEATASAIPGLLSPILLFLMPWFFLREVKPRGNPGTGAWIPDAPTRSLS